MKRLTGFLLLFIAMQLSAQSLKSIERDLLTHLKNIQRDYQADNIDYDDINVENDIFTAKLIYYLKKQPKTLTYSFGSLVKDRLQISSSADKNFRIYSWSINYGGRDDFIYNIHQFRNKSTYDVMGNEDIEESGSVIDIFEATLNGKRYYFPYIQLSGSGQISNQKLSNCYVSEYGLESDEPLFQLGEEPEASILIGFDFFSVVDREERPVRLIKFDSKTKTFSIPSIDPRTMKVTKKIEKYKFSGKYFE